jgi:uncharacterized protein
VQEPLNFKDGEARRRPRLELTISLNDARRLFVTKQGLAAKPRTSATKKDLVQLFRELGCVQIDPITAVAPSHFLVLWSRLGAYDRSLIGEMYRERLLFEYWAHQLSILLWEDYPLFLLGMRSYPDPGTEWGKRVASWLKANGKLETYILSELRKNGPLPSRAFEDQSERRWVSSGWSNNRNVSRMLQFLFFQGKVMVTERSSNTKLWDLAERCVPPGYQTQKDLGEDEIEYLAVQRALKALGVASAPQIKKHFMRDSYPQLNKTLARLEAESKIVRVKVKKVDDGKKPWFIHVDDLQLLVKLQSGDWTPKTVLLSPFDNLICDRTRTAQLFGFDFTMEIYVPQKLRKYGYYVMPVLHGDRLVARIDPVFRKDSRELVINKIFPERDFHSTEIGSEVAKSISELAGFLGAAKIRYEKVPAFWKRVLKPEARL